MRLRGLSAIGGLGTAAAVAVMLVAAMLTSSDTRGAQAATARLNIAPPSQVVEVGDTVSVTVSVQDVSGMVSWEFILRYEEDVLEYVDASIDKTLLEQAGSPFCPLPIVGEEEDRVTIGCATMNVSGAASGSGTLATINFRATGNGKSPMVFTTASLSYKFAEDVPVDPGTGMVCVGECTSPEPTPTPDRALLTPTPRSGTTTHEPVPETDPNTGRSGAPATPRAGTSGQPGSGDGSSSGGSRSGGSLQGATASSGSGSAGGQQGSAAGAGAPGAGSGPQQDDDGGWLRMLLAGTAGAGLALLAGGVAARRKAT